ncbi:hypothetical protein BJ912DRAFT_1059431 [Pholiota molesta]|nr:hypothetical protein BJ912DRAFT_1059431 [Pholiota molesta]
MPPDSTTPAASYRDRRRGGEYPSCARPAARATGTAPASFARSRARQWLFVKARTISTRRKHLQSDTPQTSRLASPSFLSHTMGHRSPSKRAKMTAVAVICGVETQDASPSTNPSPLKKSRGKPHNPSVYPHPQTSLHAGGSIHR